MNLAYASVIVQVTAEIWQRTRQQSIAAWREHDQQILDERARARIDADENALRLADSGKKFALR